MNEFKQYLIDNYDHNTLADIARHGCSGGVSGMIYYEQTSALYRKFAHALHDAVREYKIATGELPQFIVQELDDFGSFSNSMVWFAAEYFAHEITQGEYIASIVDGKGLRNIPLYTTPPQRTWIGLTDEDISKISQRLGIDHDDSWTDLKQAIEAKLKEKNT